MAYPEAGVQRPGALYDYPDHGYLETVVAGTGVSIDTTDPINPVISVTGSGVVASVVAGTGIGVDSTDPLHPIVSNTGVLGVVAGTNVTVDNTDPQHPIVASSGGGGGGSGASVLFLDISVTASDMSGLSQKTYWIPSQDMLILQVFDTGSTAFDMGGTASYSLTDPATLAATGPSISSLTTLTSIVSVPELNYEFNVTGPAVVTPTNPLIIASDVPSDYVSGVLNIRIFYEPVTPGGGGTGGGAFTMDFSVTASDMSGLTSLTLWTPTTEMEITAYMPLTSVDFDAGGSAHYYVGENIAYTDTTLMPLDLNAVRLKAISTTAIPGDSSFAWASSNVQSQTIVTPTNPLVIFSDVPSDYVSGTLAFRIYYTPVLSGAASSGLITRRYTIGFADVNTGVTLQTYTQNEVLVGFNVQNALCTDFAGLGLGDALIGAAPGGDPSINFHAFMLISSLTPGLPTLSTDPYDFPVNYTNGSPPNVFSIATPLCLVNASAPDGYTSGILVIDVYTAAT